MSGDFLWGEGEKIKKILSADATRVFFLNLSTSHILFLSTTNLLILSTVNHKLEFSLSTIEFYRRQNKINKLNLSTVNLILSTINFATSATRKRAERNTI